ncbi:MAG TPA: DUF5655 domain-containing protein [Myxococcales bacterium]|jgi:hypothetical protein
MAKAKDHDEPRPARRRSAVPDVTEKMPLLPQLGDEAEDEDEDELTRTDPGLAPDRRSANLKKPEPAPPPATRKQTPPARPAPPVALAKAAPGSNAKPHRPKPPAQPAPALGDEEEEEPEPTMVVDQLTPHFSGAKAGLKPVYDSLLDAAKRLGQQVKIIAGPQYVTLMRNREFAILEETPQGDRVELGLVLPGRPPTRRLLRARHFDWGDRFTHHVTLRYKTDVDSEVRSWLTDACWTGG